MVTFTQGPATLMRHILRYSSNGHDIAPDWTSSRTLSVTILDQPRTAWLLTNNMTTVLVVEVDEIMLHIVGPEEYLTGSLLNLLPQLTWTPPGRIPFTMSTFGPKDRILVLP